MTLTSVNPSVATPATGARLGRRTVAGLPPEVSVPTYDVATMRAGVAHIGVGRFHRAHQARYFDELAERRISSAWAVVGVGMRQTSTRGLLAAQDQLFSVVEMGPAGPTARVVGALQRYYHAPSEHQALVRLLSDPALPLVTLTITAEAYRTAGPDSVPPVFALLAEALVNRRRQGHAPFTVLSCDNLVDNGSATRRAVLAATDQLDASGRCSRWVARNGAFPRSMADRITPVMDDDLRAVVAERLGVTDTCAVVAERHTDWVVEDAFSSERPPLHEVGVRYVADVRPWAEAKMRLLNGGHCAVGFLGTIAGHRTSAEAMADPVIKQFVTDLLRREIAPTLTGAGGPALGPYCDTVLRRMSDPTLADPLTRLTRRGSVRIPTYLLPSLLDALSAGHPARRLTLVLAAWAVHLRRAGCTTEDPLAQQLADAAECADLDARPLLHACPALSGLAGIRPLLLELQAQVRDLERHGTAEAIRRSGAPSAGSLDAGRRARTHAGLAPIAAQAARPEPAGGYDAAAS